MTKEQQLFNEYSSVWLPPPKLDVANWADTQRRLSSESSATPGIWRTSRAEYQREIMNALSNSLTERVIVMTAAQIGKTELLLNTISSTLIDLELLLYYPKNKSIYYL